METDLIICERSSAGEPLGSPDYKKERRISFDEFPFIAPEDGWVRCSGIGYGGTGWTLLADGMVIFHYSASAGGSTSATVSPVKKGTVLRAVCHNSDARTQYDYYDKAMNIITGSSHAQHGAYWVPNK